MTAQFLKIDTIRENRDLKEIGQEEINELLTTLYDFSILTFEAYNKKYISHGEY